MSSNVVFVGLEKSWLIRLFQQLSGMMKRMRVLSSLCLILGDDDPILSHIALHELFDNLSHDMICRDRGIGTWVILCPARKG